MEDMFVTGRVFLIKYPATSMSYSY